MSKSQTTRSELHYKTNIRTCSDSSTAWSKIGLYVSEMTLAAFRPKTDEAQQGVNAFGIVSCGFSVLSAAHIFASVKNKMYQ